MLKSLNVNKSLIFLFCFLFFLHVTSAGRTNRSEVLIDLMGLDVQGVSRPPTSPLSLPVDLLCGSAPGRPRATGPTAPSAALSLLDEELLSLGDHLFICHGIMEHYQKPVIAT